MELPVANRAVAGKALAEALVLYKDRDDVIVLDLPRGGVALAPSDTVVMLRREVDEMVCLAEPEPFMAIDQWYVDFSQVSDDELRDMLAEAWVDE